MATKASVEIVAEDKFSATLRAARAEFSNLQGSIGRITAVTGSLNGAFAGMAATFVAGGLIGGIQSLVGSIDDLDEAAQGLGTTAVALSELQLAARESGVGADQLGAALTRLNVKVAEAAGGNKEAMQVFKAMGIAVRDANGNVRSTEAVLNDVANAFSKYEDGLEKSALAVELFGKSGAKLIAYLNQGGDALRKNSGLTEETVQQAIKLQREFDKLGANIERVKNSIAGGLIPALNNLFDLWDRFSVKDASKGFAFGMAGGIVSTAIAAANATKDLKALNEVAEENQRLLNRAFLAQNGEGKRNAPVIDKKPDKEKKKKEEIDMPIGASELGQLVDSWLRLGDAIEAVSEQEKVLQLLKDHPGIDTPQVRELMLREAEKADKLKAEIEMNKELTRIKKEQFDEEKRLTDQVLELAGVAEEERKIALTKQLEIMVAQGRLSQEQALQAVKGIAGIKDELKETNNVANQFAMTFSSALEDVIVKGGDARDMLQGLLQDILRIATRSLITQPFTKWLSGLLGGDGGGGGIGFGGLAGLFGGFVGGGAGGGGGFGYVPFGSASAGAGDLIGLGAGIASTRNIRPVNVTNNYNNNIAQVGSNVSRVDMLSAMQQTEAATRAKWADDQARRPRFRD